MALPPAKLQSSNPFTKVRTANPTTGRPPTRNDPVVGVPVAPSQRFDDGRLSRWKSLGSNVSCAQPEANTGISDTLPMFWTTLIEPKTGLTLVSCPRNGNVEATRKIGGG